MGGVMPVERRGVKWFERVRRLSLTLGVGFGATGSGGQFLVLNRNLVVLTLNPVGAGEIKRKIRIKRKIKIT